MPTVADLPQHIYYFAAVLGLLLAAFVLFYFAPALLLSRRLSKAIVRLADGRQAAGSDLGRAFDMSGPLRALWREYAATLHKQPAPVRGSEPAVILRSTLPAAAVFRSESIVHTTLHTDFFKHLPGLFTGIGIIGTFYGLLTGLQAFDVSDNPIVVRNSLKLLLHGVSEAFLISAAAITLAMAITFAEKLTIARLNAKVEKIAQLLDGLFVGGANEEYLARLVHASEAAAKTPQRLEGELKRFLAELAAGQIAAVEASSAALGDRIVRSLELGVAGPVGEIAAALKEAGSDRDAAVQTMLREALTLFGREIDALFGRQAAGIHGQQQQTLDALQAAVVALQTTAASIEAAGRHATAGLAQTLAESTAAAEARQRIMNEKMAEFVDQMRLAIAATQGESQAQMRAALADLTAAMREAIERLGAQAQLTAEAGDKRQNDLAAASRDVIGQFGGQVAALLEGVSRAAGEMKAAAGALRGVAGETMVRLNSGADTLYLAAKDFAKAGQAVTATLDKSTAVAAHLGQAAGSVAAAASGLSGVVADYKGARDAMVALVGTMQTMLEQARREASMSGAVLARIEGATAKLVDAQREADGYLDKVTEVIGGAHESFAAAMTRTVGTANRDFHQALSDSVKLLREGIQELEGTLGNAVGAC
ncbi:MAG: hypothetical protein HZC24_13805 [Rhodocyclales bacterium]|nr:hypothetical protein [Rhodocyclales bacterium]